MTYPNAKVNIFPILQKFFNPDYQSRLFVQIISPDYQDY